MNIIGMLKSGKLQTLTRSAHGREKNVENVETASLLRCYVVLDK